MSLKKDKHKHDVREGTEQDASPKQERKEVENKLYRPSEPAVFTIS